MDFSLITETESQEDDSSLPLHKSKSLAAILTEINQKVQNMLKLIEDAETVSTEKFLCLYQSLGETYNDLNQELLNGLLNFDFKMPSSDHDSASSLVTPVEALSSCKPGAPLKNQLVSPGRTTCSRLLKSLKLNRELEKDQADMFCAELELEARNIDTETDKRYVLDLESKLLDSGYKIESVESELDVIKECLGVSEAEVSKLSEMLIECKTEKANMQSGNAADMLDSLRTELRSREIQIEQMEEYLNQVCVKDTEITPESETDKNAMEELRARVEVLEKQVELQRNVITEREEEKREAIRQLCYSVDHYMSRYLELVRSLSLSDNKKGMVC